MLYGIIPRNSVPFKPSTDIPDLSEKVILITGGNTGLGARSALRLAAHSPSHIYLLCRTPSKAQTSIESIKASIPTAKITSIQCDLTSLSSVQSAAREFLTLSQRLDMLFLNAGIMGTPAAVTSEGYEIQFGTNHVGHALLTKLLLPTLLKTAALPGGDVRVVSLSSVGHLWTTGTGISFEELKTPMQRSLAMTRYGQSKLANILFTKALAKRYPTLTAVAVHPGVVDTDLYVSVFKWIPGMSRVLEKAKGMVITNVEEGAWNQLWAATAKKGDGAGAVTSGEYYTPVGLAGNGSRWAGDAELAEKLWVWTEKELEGWDI